MKKLLSRFFHPKKLPPKLGSEVLEEKQQTVDTIFVHVHKCAGTSLIETLSTSPHVICCVARPGDFPNRTGRERIPNHIWKRSRKFTFLRHPYARVVSAFKMFMKSAKWQNTFRDFDGFLEFLRWVDLSHHSVDRERPTQEYVQTIDNVIHHCSSYSNPKYMLGEMDFIGQLESFDVDYQQIQKEFGMKLPHPSHLNPAIDGDHGDLLNSERKSRIYSLYQEDFETLGYER